MAKFNMQTIVRPNGSGDDLQFSAGIPNGSGNILVGVLAAANGTIKNLAGYGDAAPGSGNSFELAVAINGSETGLALSFNATDQSLVNGTDTATYNAGDLITFIYLPSGTPATKNVTLSWEQDQ